MRNRLRSYIPHATYSHSVPVDIGKFSMCVEKFCPGLTDFEVKLLFDYLDTDRSKSLSRPELGERLLAEPAERFPVRGLCTQRQILPGDSQLNKTNGIDSCTTGA